MLLRLTNYFRVMITKNLLVLKKTVLGFAIVWTVLIVVLCLVSFNNLPSFGVSNIDKYVHFTFHFIFTLLWGFYLSLKQNKIEINKIGIIIAISLFFGILIEFLQETFTKTRQADNIDVLANFAGATTALILFIIIKAGKKSKQ